MLKLLFGCFSEAIVLLMLLVVTLSFAKSSKLSAVATLLADDFCIFFNVLLMFKFDPPAIPLHSPDGFCSDFLFFFWFELVVVLFSFLL